MKPSYFLAVNAGISLLIFGILIGFFFLIFSLVKVLSYSDIFSFLHSGDAAGVSYFEMTSNESCYLKGPDIEQAVRTERRKFYVTAYCPPASGYDEIEGGQMSAAGIKLAMGAVAVPPFSTPPIITGNTPDYPWGTTFDIPGYGRGVAVDHGAAIQKAGVSKGRWKATPYDHLDIFVGWGKDQCGKKWQTKIVEATVYWFDPKVYPPSKAKKFIHRICDGGGWGGGSGGGWGGGSVSVSEEDYCIKEDRKSQCGVASAAMVIAYQTGKVYTTSQLLADSSIRVGPNSVNILAALNKYTNTSWEKTKWDFERAIRSIQANYPVVIYTGRYAGRHIMVLSGYKDGKFKINNPLPGKCVFESKTRGEIESWGAHADVGKTMIFPKNIK